MHDAIIQCNKATVDQRNYWLLQNSTYIVYCLFSGNSKIAYSKLKDFITYIGNTGNTPETMYFGYLLYKIQQRLQITKIISEVDETILSPDEKSLLKAIIGSVEEQYKKS